MTGNFLFETENPMEEIMTSDSVEKFMVIDTIKLRDGMVIDLDEGWRKLISSQFGGNPGRGFSELIQNMLDSYDASVPWQEREGEITSEATTISITDYGEGMSRARLKLLTTLGGTDKDDDPNKIGKFGIGFVSIFNPRLGTKAVRVRTCCEGHGVELFFKVEDSDKRPAISTKIHDQTFPFSTRIDVMFDNALAVSKCLSEAGRCLHYYPCRVSINGDLFQSVWQEAKKKGAYFFKDGSCDGFLLKSESFYKPMPRITLLCKYEHVMDSRISSLVNGGHDMKYDLRDYEKKKIPYLPDYDILINCNDLFLTISRDGFFMNMFFDEMVEVIRKVLMQKLHEVLGKENQQIILANQYILKDMIGDYLKKQATFGKGSPELGEESVLIKKLAEAKLYRIKGKRKAYSLKDIHNRLSHDLPMFYSPEKKNTRWLSGNFKHDFIVLPPTCDAAGGSPDFYDALFTKIFKDCVNLDTITQEHLKIKTLVEREIVDKSSLSPKSKFIGQKKLSLKEKEMLDSINEILGNPFVKSVIEKNIQMNISKLRSVFFDVNEKGAYISTGLFTENEKALDSITINNIETVDDQGTPVLEKSGTIYLGIRRKHHFIELMLACNNPYKVYYTLTYLAHELALCQKHLVPYSPFYNLVKEKLAADMRRALIRQLVPQEKAA